MDDLDLKHRVIQLQLETEKVRSKAKDILYDTEYLQRKLREFMLCLSQSGKKAIDTK